MEPIQIQALVCELPPGADLFEKQFVIGRVEYFADGSVRTVQTHQLVPLAEPAVAVIRTATRRA